LKKETPPGISASLGRMRALKPGGVACTVIADRELLLPSLAASNAALQYQCQFRRLLLY
jgi:hypothetical protein